MADQKISALTAKTTVADTDMFVMVDEEASPDETKKITGANMKSQMVASHAADADAHGEPTITTDSGTVTADDQAFSVVGGEGIDTSGATTTLTIAGEDASATNKGIVELATTAETTTGTDATRAVTPDGLKDGYQGSANVTTLGTIATGTWEATDVGVAHGGTGASSLTDHGVLVGSGTDAVTALAVGTNGQVIVGSTGADPTFATITDGEGIDTTTGAGTLQIDCEDASATNKGVVELATTAETTTGTDATRAVTPDGLKDGYQGSTNVTTLGTVSTGTWQGDVVDHERGGLEADVSAYSGLVKISGGSTSAATIGIEDDNIVEIDDADVANGDYAKFTANGLQGRSASEVRTDINVADGADVTGDNAPQAHHDSHDPADGSDALDCAAASEIAGVQAAAEGSAHSFARSDHAHQIQHGIADNHLVTIDDDDADANDYAKFTGNGLEGRSYAETLSDLSGEATGAFDFNGQNVTVNNLVIADGGNIGSVSDTDAMAISAAGILTLSAQSRAEAHRSTATQELEDSVWCVAELDTESFDAQNEMDNTNNTGTAEAGTAGTTIHDDGVFTNAQAGDTVWNTTQNLYDTIDSVTSNDEIETVAAHGMAVGNTFKWFRSRFTATEAGYYQINGNATSHENLADGEKILAGLYKNGVAGTRLGVGRCFMGAADWGGASCSVVVYLEANDYVQLAVYQNSGTGTTISNLAGYTAMSVHRLS